MNRDMNNYKTLKYNITAFIQKNKHTNVNALVRALTDMTTV